MKLFIFNNKLNNNMINLFVTSILVLYFYSSLYSLPDRSNYIRWHFEPAIYKFNMLFQLNIKDVIFEEPIWKTINAVLINFISPENMVFVIITINIVAFYYISFNLIDKYTQNKLSAKLFFIFITISVLDGLLVRHIRQGLAFNLFLYSFLFTNKKQNFIVLLTPLIHYSMYFILPIFYLSKLYDKYISSKVGPYLVISISLIVISTFFIIYPILAQSIGMQLYIDSDGGFVQHSSTSGIGVLFYFGLLIIFFFQGKNFIKDNMMVYLFITMFLVSYFTFPSPGRLFLNAQPLILIAGFKLTKDRYYLFIIAFTLLTLFEIVY